MIQSTLRRAWIAAAITLAFTGCSDPAAIVLPREGVPDEFVFTTSGYGTGSTTVRVDGDAVVVRRAQWDPAIPADSVRRVPNTQQWTAFWAAADAAGVARWRERYFAEGVVDGVGWSLRIVADGRAVDSGGANAYPDERGREHENEETVAFRGFLDALADLTGQPF